MSKLQSTCSEEHFEEKIIFLRRNNLFKSFWDNEQKKILSLSAIIFWQRSKLNSTCLKELFEDFFEKNYVFISFPETEQENFRPLTKIIWQRCHNCFPRLQRNILRNVLFPGKTMFF